jgi:hypothetical protein
MSRWVVAKNNIRQSAKYFVGEKENREMCKSTKPRKRFLVSGLLLFGLLGTVRVSSALDVGDKAPDFTLPSTTGEKISLSQFRGKKLVLLEFYGADYSPV